MGKVIIKVRDMKLALSNNAFQPEDWAVQLAMKILNKIIHPLDELQMSFSCDWARSSNLDWCLFSPRSLHARVKFSRFPKEISFTSCSERSSHLFSLDSRDEKWILNFLLLPSFLVSFLCFNNMLAKWNVFNGDHFQGEWIKNAF